MRWLVIILTLMWVGSGAAQTVDNSKAATYSDTLKIVTPADSAGTPGKKQIIKLEESEIEGRLSKPQVIFLLQHNEHAFRTFNIRKDVSEELKRYIPKEEMIKRYRIFYEERLKDRLW